MTRRRSATPSSDDGLLGDVRGRRRLEREDLDRILRRRRVERPARRGERLGRAPPPTPRAHRSRRRTPKSDVPHRRAVGDGEREREERDPALGVDRAVDRVDDDAHRASGAERDARRAPPRRARSRPRGPRGARRRRPPPPRRSPSCRRHPRPAGAPARARCASAARPSTASMSATQSRQSAEPVDASYRVEEQAARQLREEVRRLLGHHLAPARALEHVLDARRPEQERTVELTRVDASDGLGEIGRVAESLVADEAIDELDVELARLARRREGRRLRRYPTAWASVVRAGGEPLDAPPPAA